MEFMKHDKHRVNCILTCENDYVCIIEHHKKEKELKKKERELKKKEKELKKKGIKNPKAG
jgi:hypothetical protein